MYELIEKYIQVVYGVWAIGTDLKMIKSAR